MLSTVLTAKCDSDVIFCLQSLNKENNWYTPLELTRFDKSLLYLYYPADRINTQLIYRLYVADTCNFVSKT